MKKYEIIKHSAWLEELLPPDKKLVLELVELHTPKKVIISAVGCGVILKALCPNCKEDDIDYDYCPYCGQALDWGDSND